MAQTDHKEKEYTSQEIRRKTIKALIGLGIGAAGIGYGIKWMVSEDKEDGLSWPLRKVLSANKKINDLYFNHQHLVPTYPINAAVPKPRLNGTIGLDSPIDLSAWKLLVEDEAPNTGEVIKRSLSLETLKALPKHEITFEFKCIEGWSEISSWAGVKFSELMAAYGLGGMKAGKSSWTETNLAPYVALETPDKMYYVGLDMPSALHPQTLLCYEMNGQPLSVEHGAPLRLIIPVKYGIKNLKRVGTIRFTFNKPKDYWGEQGYDYDAAL